MNKIKYDQETSLTNFMDQYTIQRLERVIKFEQSSTPSDVQLIQSCTNVIHHLKGIWGI